MSKKRAKIKKRTASKYKKPNGLMSRGKRFDALVEYFKRNTK